MRKLLSFAFYNIATVLAACTSFEPPASYRTTNATTYYDRNHDGIVDFELHNALVPDGAWTLCDTKFRRRYDLKTLYGYTVTTERIDLPVPRHVTITPGTPAVLGPY